MACLTSYRLCDRIVHSQSITVITVNGTDTLVIDLPQQSYNNNEKYFIVLTQSIPAGATRYMPVAFSIGGVTTTVYPFVARNGSQVTQSSIRTNTMYPVCVATSNTSGVFRSLGGLCCSPTDNLQSLPVTTT